jgi:hypothetical protein
MGGANPVLNGLLRGFQLANQIKMQQRWEQQAESLNQHRELTRERQEQQASEQQRVTRRREELENLDRVMQLREKGGMQLSPEQMLKLAQGEDFSVALGPGMATTASSAQQVKLPGGETFLLPQMADLAERDRQVGLDKIEDEQEAKAVPVPSAVAKALGLPEGARAPATVVDDYMRSFNALQRAGQPRMKSAIDDEGNLVEMDLNTGQRTVRPFFDKKPKGEPKLSPTEARMQEKASSERATRSVVNKAIAGATDSQGKINLDKAKRAIIAAAKEDPSVNLLDAIYQVGRLEPRSTGSRSSGLDSLYKDLGIDTGEEEEAGAEDPLGIR